jgi:hypothetical protein
VSTLNPIPPCPRCGDSHGLSSSEIALCQDNQRARSLSRQQVLDVDGVDPEQLLYVETDVAQIPPERLDAIRAYIAANHAKGMVVLHNPLNEMPQLTGVAFHATDVMPIGYAAIMDGDVLGMLP